MAEYGAVLKLSVLGRREERQGTGGHGAAVAVLRLLSQSASEQLAPFNLRSDKLQCPDRAHHTQLQIEKVCPRILLSSSVAAFSGATVQGASSFESVKDTPSRLAGRIFACLSDLSRLWKAEQRLQSQKVCSMHVSRPPCDPYDNLRFNHGFVLSLRIQTKCVRKLSSSFSESQEDIM